MKKQFEIKTVENKIIILGYNDEQLILIQPFNSFTKDDFKSIEDAKEYIKSNNDFNEETDFEGDFSITIIKEEQNDSNNTEIDI